MTPSQAINDLLGDVAFTAPVSIEDCAQVRDALREVLPSSSIEVYCHMDDFVVVVVDNVRKFIEVAPCT